MKRGLNTKKNKGFLATGAIGVVTLIALAISVFTLNKGFSQPAAVIQAVEEETTTEEEEVVVEELEQTNNSGSTTTYITGITSELLETRLQAFRNSLTLPTQVIQNTTVQRVGGGSGISEAQLEGIFRSIETATSGTLDSGSITANFGNINIGQSTIAANTGTFTNATITNLLSAPSAPYFTATSTTATSTFAGHLDLAGSITLNSLAGTLGQVLVSQGTSTDPIWSEGGAFSSSGGYTTLNTSSDSVGIGTTTPSSILQVAGDITPSTDDLHNLGNATYRWDDIYATNGTIQTSDMRWKENVEDILYGLETINALRAVSYDWINSPEDGSQLGVIAQEVIEILPEVVNIGDDDNTTLGIRYTGFIPVIIKAIQELSDQVEALAAQAGSSVANIFKAQEITAEDKLCVGEVCITEDEFRSVFGDGIEQEEETATTTPEVIEEVVEEPVVVEETATTTPEVIEEVVEEPVVVEETATTTPEVIEEFEVDLSLLFLY
ncbi:MAG: hypothetical protein ACI9GH_000590 [Candidatus Paceibacteria bacterium]